ncbi:MAG: hypothetical protein H6Q41_3807 [Deltaproteobacteria bacterium]|nr:hypothetical protein [Deltaproteobacteria bacterium]
MVIFFLKGMHVPVNEDMMLRLDEKARCPLPSYPPTPLQNDERSDGVQMNEIGSTECRK